MGGSIPWHGWTRALPTTWPSQNTTQRSTGSTWATALQKSTHFRALECFFPPSSVTVMNQIQCTLTQLNEGLWPVFTSQHMLSMIGVEWDMQKGKICCIFFHFRFSAFFGFFNMCNCPCLHISHCWVATVSWCCCHWMCELANSYGLVFNLPHCQ